MNKNLLKMKIKSNKRNENNEKNNYNIIYQKIKEEIKSVVINKLLNQIQSLYKKYVKLQKENSIIKNDLIYILKRVLLNKNEYININDNNNTTTSKNYKGKSAYTLNGLKSNSYFNSKSYNSFLSSTEKINNESSNYNQLYSNYYNKNNNNNNNNSANRNPIDKRRYSIDDDFRKPNNSSYSHLENSMQFNIQNKIDYYLNSLYKHNFSEECVSGTSSVYLLNRNQSIYDELFSNKNSRHKSLSHVKTDQNFKKVSDGHNLYINNDNYDSDSYIKINKNNNNLPKNQTNNYLKVHRKGNVRNTNPKKKIYNKIKHSGSKSSSNMIASSNSKNHRSRFLVNKF